MTNDEIIYSTAVGGSPVNPGLPPALASLVLAQAKHETGNFTSNFFKKYNNAFGYAAVKGGVYQSAAGTLADNNLPIAVYPSVKNSVYEIVDWIYRRQKAGIFPANLATITTPEQYGQLLKNGGYYGDTVTNYINGLKRFFVANPVIAAAGVSGLLIAAIVAAYIYRGKLRRIFR